MTYNIKHKIGSIVYFILDPEQNPLIVVSIWIREDGVQYECRDVNSECRYYNAFELSKEENILIKIK